MAELNTLSLPLLLLCLIRKAWNLWWRMEVNGYPGWGTDEDLTDERELGQVTCWLFVVSCVSDEMCSGPLLLQCPW